MTLLSALGLLAPACLSLHASLPSVPGSWNFSLSHKRAIRHRRRGWGAEAPAAASVFFIAFL